MMDIHVDIGNLDLLQNIFRDNIELCLSLTKDKLLYFLKLIAYHGQEAEFLEIFNILVTHEGNSDIKALQKKVLRVLLNDKWFTCINPSIFATGEPDKPKLLFSSKP